MNKKLISWALLCMLFLFLITIKTYAQPSSGDCDPLATIDEDGYCQPVPLDENVTYIVIAAICFGVYKLRRNQKLQTKFES